MVWPKAVELLLALPFILGVKTEVVSRLLALSLILEALYAWAWWRIPGDPTSFAHHRRAIHYREHFVTNVATACLAADLSAPLASQRSAETSCFVPAKMHASGRWAGGHCTLLC